jgi:TusE/DsrC/DsvC family sulfur relay protein
MHTTAAANSRPRLQHLEFDADGFLIDPERWSEQAARRIAEVDGVGQLTPAHWAIIHYLREHYFAYGSMPPAAHACHVHGMDKHAVRRLFGGCRAAWRIAGLPNPGEEALSYMS